MTHALSGNERITIGRAPDNTIVIDDASVSRHHAVLDLGPPLTVEDLGSANGTRVRPAQSSAETVELAPKLAPGKKWEIGVDEPFNIGSAMCVVRLAENVAREKRPELP